MKTKLLPFSALTSRIREQVTAGGLYLVEIPAAALRAVRCRGVSNQISTLAAAETQSSWVLSNFSVGELIEKIQRK